MRKTVFLSCFLITAGLFFRLLPARAGQITLSITTSTRILHGKVEAAVKITNSGTETARMVSVQARFLKERNRLFAAEKIAPEESAQAVMPFSLPPDLRGSYPLYVLVSYLHPDDTNVSSAALGIVDIQGSGGQPLLEIRPELRKAEKPGVVLVGLAGRDPRLDKVEITSHFSEDLEADARVRRVSLKDGKAEARFRLSSRKGGEGRRHGVFFVAEYDLDGVHHLAQANLNVPLERAAAGILRPAHKRWPVIFALPALILAGIVLSLMSPGARQWMVKAFDEGKGGLPLLLDLLALAAVLIFIAVNLSPQYLLTKTTATGGDTASHYYTLQYLRHELLPAGRVTGWTPGNYAGFPMLQFYFPLPFLIMCFLDLFLPLQVAFKLVTLMGVFFLPVGAYLMLRLLRCPFPGPGIGAALMLPFLFNPANSMWGGNILSTLAGEFSYSLSMSLSLVLLGSLYRGAMDDNRRVILNAALVFLVGFSHGYTLLFAEAVSIFWLLTSRGFVGRLVYLLKVYLLGFCLLAFWLVPLIVFTPYTTPYHLAWTINSIKELAPPILLPLIVMAGAGSFGLLAWGLSTYRRSAREALVPLAYFWFGLAVSVVFFIIAPRLGVVDIRYVPYGQLMAVLPGAMALGWSGRALQRWGLSWALLVLAVPASMVWTGGQLGPAPGWAKWNYEGFEAKSDWPVFRDINQALKGNFQDPRVVFEHSPDHGVFGSTRAFESLPLFSGRATLEGLYMQASISAPFVFYIQSEISHIKSRPFPQYTYTNMNFHSAVKRLQLFNVKDLILRSSSAKQAIRKAPQYRLKQTIGSYELWELTTNRNRYVVPLKFEPVFFSGKPWKGVAHEWFASDDLLDVHLVLGVKDAPGAGRKFKAAAASLENLPRIPVDTGECGIKEAVGNQEILIETDCIDKPLLVKMTYHPNWKVQGADRVFLVSPSFMLIYPKQPKVRLYYGPGPWDRLGQALTAIGILVLLLNLPLFRLGRPAAWSSLADRLGVQVRPAPRPTYEPGSRVRRAAPVAALILAGLAVSGICYHIYTSDPNRIFNRSVKYKDAGRFEAARDGFRHVRETLPHSALARESAYYIAISYFLEGNDSAAVQAFEDLILRYPKSSWVPEAIYHTGICFFRSGQEQQGIARMRRVLDNFPETRWAGFARDRLREHHALEEQPPPLRRATAGEYLAEGVRMFNAERLEEARSIFEKIVAQFPDFAGAPLALGTLALSYYKQGDCAGTIRQYQKFIKQYPKDRLIPEAFYHLGLCYEKTGQEKLSLWAYKTVAAEHPETVYGRQAAEKLKGR
ncbi:MAG: 6-pyruvoyl-tetrahydropterin synthase-related protein [Desulfobacterales bacterium]|nr:6-pyruvoyl-tetrahydropterin synthase-related protein [Desulfobacterales bacterium]